MSRIYIVVIAMVAAFIGYQAIKYSGVVQERARVQQVGEKTHAKAQAVRKSVEAKKPEQVRSDLGVYCRDCR